MKLLIAEDEDMTRNGMEKYIRLHTDRFDHIYTASNGIQAIETIFRDRPDILLLDIQMPGRTGIEVMQEADQAGILPETVILSGYDEFRYAQQAMRYGARQYLLKPIRSTEILKILLDLAQEIEEGEQEAARAPLPAPPAPVRTRQTGIVKAQTAAAHGGLGERIKSFIDEHYSEDLTLQMVADHAGISYGYLSTLCPQLLGMGFVDYINRVRIEHACAYLRNSYFKTYEVAYRVGYQDEKYFTRVFKKTMGMPPREYRKQFQGS